MNPFRRLRESRGLTRREFALLLGTSVSHIQAVESGLPRRPYRPLMQALTIVVGQDEVSGLAAEYETWRVAQAATLREAFTATR